MLGPLRQLVGSWPEAFHLLPLKSVPSQPLPSPRSQYAVQVRVLETNQVPSGGGSNMMGDSTGYSFRQKEENRWIWEPNITDQARSCQKDYQEPSVFFIIFNIFLKILYC